MTQQLDYPDRTWWHRGRPYSRLEVLGDALVHVVGLVIAVGLGGLLLTVGGLHTAPDEWPMLLVYVASLLVVLTVSLAFNMAPVTPLKRLLARFDQAAIFLLIAGTYTPVLALHSVRPKGWSSSASMTSRSTAFSACTASSWRASP